MRAALHAANVTLLCGALLATGAPADASGQFVVGASAADITPPLAASAPSNPADCDLTATFDGPHLFSLEEPYKDLNGNGRYDANPEDGGPEPFVDCPTPTANGGTRPPDGRWDGIYLDGGSGHNRIPTTVLDPIWARTIVVGNGIHKISITVADEEGVFKEIWDFVRQKVRSDGGFGLDEMFMSSTRVRWMDVRGRAQGAAGDAPTMQTRGIMLGQRRRFWVDVFPETTGLTRIP